MRYTDRNNGPDTASAFIHNTIHYCRSITFYRHAGRAAVCRERQRVTGGGSSSIFVPKSWYFGFPNGESTGPVSAPFPSVGFDFCSGPASVSVFPGTGCGFMSPSVFIGTGFGFAIFFARCGTGAGSSAGTVVRAARSTTLKPSTSPASRQ